MKLVISLFFTIFVTFLSFESSAGNCIEIKNGYEFNFIGNGNGNCTSNKGLNIYSTKNKNSFLKANNNGFTISMTFDREKYVINNNSEVILFGAYSDFDGNNILLEIGINSSNQLFYKQPDEKFTKSINNDPTISNPHTLIISYDERKKKTILTIDGREVTQDNIDPIMSDIRVVNIGKNFTGKIVQIIGFKRKFGVIDRSYESKRLSSIYKVFVPPLKTILGIKKAENLCLDSQILKNGDCKSTIEAFVSNPLPFGISIPEGTSIDPPATGSVTASVDCLIGFTASTSPAPSFTINSNGIITYNGSCISPDLCNVSNIPASFNGVITSPISYGANQNFACIANYIGNVTLNCTDGSAIDMSSDTSCSDVSTTTAIENYINSLIAASITIDSTVRNNIKTASNVADATIDSTIDTTLAASNSYNCNVSNIPASFNGVITSPISYGANQNFACIANYIGNVTLNCTDGSAIDMSSDTSCSDVSTTTAIENYINSLIAASITIDSTVRNNIKTASNVADATIDSTIDTTLAASNSYNCNVSNIPASFNGVITSPISYGANQNFACIANYIGNVTLNCTDGSAIDMSSDTSCSDVSTTTAIENYINSLIAASITIDSTVRNNIKTASNVADATIDSTIDTTLAASNSYNCNVSNIPASFNGVITSPISYGANQNFACIANYIGNVTLNCTDGSAIDMSSDTSCSDVSTTTAIENYINSLIAASITIDSTVRNNIKTASNVADATIDSTIDTTLAASNSYNCNVSNIPASFNGVITSPLSYGANQNFACIANYIGNVTLNCTDGSAIDMSSDTSCSDVSTTTAIENYINSLIAASITIDSTVRNNIKTASNVADTTIDSTIDTTLAASNSYNCNVSNIPASFNGVITSPLSYGANQNFACIANYIGNVTLNCTDGSAIDMSSDTSCSDVSTTTAIENYINSLIAASITIDSTVRNNIKTASNVADTTIDSTIDTILAASNSYDCNITSYPSPTNFFSNITSPLNYGSNQTFSCDLGYAGSGITINCDASNIDISTGGDCTIRSYNVGSSGTDLIVANTNNTNITYDAAYLGTLTADTIGIPCSVGYIPSDSNLNGLLQYQFNATTGNVEMEGATSCNARTYIAGTDYTLPADAIDPSVINYNNSYISPTYSSGVDGIACNSGFSPSDIDNLIRYRFNATTGNIELKSGVSCVADPIPFEFILDITPVTTINLNDDILHLTTVGSIFNFRVDWGDGTTDNNIYSNGGNTDISHTYSTTGEKTIKINGTLDGFKFSPDISDTIAYLKRINKWGNVKFSNDASFTFAKEDKFTGIEADAGLIDTSNVTSMSNMFELATNFNSDISSWNVSNVTNMNGVFAEAYNFNQDISSWNVSNVTNMSWMLSRLNNFNYNLSGWNVNNVTNCNGFSRFSTNWSLSKPTFNNCPEDPN